MLIDPDLAEFITSPVMMIIGTQSGSNRPEIGRCVGSRVAPGRREVDIIISAWQWRGTVDNLRANGQAAVTFVRPSDYTSYQLKGRARVRPSGPEEAALSEAYIAAVTAALDEQGVQPAMAAVWLTNKDPVIARISVETVSIKTPGHQAGTVLKANHDVAAS